MTSWGGHAGTGRKAAALLYSNPLSSGIRSAISFSRSHSPTVLMSSHTLHTSSSPQRLRWRGATAGHPPARARSPTHPAAEDSNLDLPYFSSARVRQRAFEKEGRFSELNQPRGTQPQYWTFD